MPVAFAKFERIQTMKKLNADSNKDFQQQLANTSDQFGSLNQYIVMAIPKYHLSWGGNSPKTLLFCIALICTFFLATNTQAQLQQSKSIELLSGQNADLEENIRGVIHCNVPCNNPAFFLVQYSKGVAPVKGLPGQAIFQTSLRSKLNPSDFQTSLRSKLNPSDKRLFLRKKKVVSASFPWNAPTMLHRELNVEFRVSIYHLLIFWLPGGLLCSAILEFGIYKF
jgi:hypothetical protein